jgi:hypothetical protein
LAVSWAHFGFPEQQATSQTRPVNSQGVPLSGVVPAVCCSACVGCLWWISTQKDAKTQFLAPWHPAVAATNNSMTALYFSSEISGLWPGLRSQKIRWKLAAAPAGCQVPLSALCSWGWDRGSYGDDQRPRTRTRGQGPGTKGPRRARWRQWRWRWRWRWRPGAAARGRRARGALGVGRCRVGRRPWAHGPSFGFGLWRFGFGFGFGFAGDALVAERRAAKRRSGEAPSPSSDSIIGFGPPLRLPMPPTQRRCHCHCHGRRQTAAASPPVDKGLPAIRRTSLLPSPLLFF